MSAPGTAARGLAILTALGRDERFAATGAGVVELAELVGDDKGAVSRTLRTLLEAGFAERDERSRRYRLAPRALGLAAASGDPALLRAAAAPLDAVAAAVGESAYLSVRHGAEMLTVLARLPEAVLRSPGRVGERFPLAPTSAGRALLAGLDDEAVRDLAGAPPFGAGPRAPRDVDALLGRVREARRRGFAVVDEEFEAGVVGVAVPVRVAGDVVAALNVSGPAFRLRGRVEEAARALRAAAAAIERAAVRGPRGTGAP